MMAVLYQSATIFFKEDLPTILGLIAKSLQNAKIPKVNEWQKLNSEQWLRLAPVLAMLTVSLASPFLLLHALSRPRSIHERRSKNTYWLTRVLLLRFMGLVYLAAFATSAFQGRALFGSNGLNPVTYPSHRPTPVFTWLVDLGVPYSDWMLELVSWVGMFLSMLLISSVINTFLLPMLLWLMYISIINQGGLVINYGWEWLTVELGFLAIFLCPVFSRSLFPRHVPPPRLVLWLFRWCAFRLLIGAGMSKLGRNSSDCWLTLTCTYTHYETQPMPNPVAWFFHHLPKSFHRFEVATTFFEQLVLPAMLLVPLREVRIFSAISELCFQVAIVGSGNYAWINFVGVLPCLALLDDAFLQLFFSRKAVQAAAEAEVLEAGPLDGTEAAITRASKASGKASSSMGIGSRAIWSLYRTARCVIYLFLVAFIARKSVAPIKELFTPAPWLHFYDEYFFVNSQGVFGFINQQRTVMVLEYTHDLVSMPPSDCKDSEQTPFNDQNTGRSLPCSDLAQYCQHPQHGTAIRRHCPLACGTCTPPQLEPGSIRWRPLHFANLPGELTRRPLFNSPYHYRLDWQVWIETTARMDFARGPQAVPGIVQTLVRKIMAGDTDAVDLTAMPREALLLSPASTRSDKGNRVCEEMGKSGGHRGCVAAAAVPVPLSEQETTVDVLPPTAMRASFYRYQFSSWDDLLGKGEWWSRVPIQGAAPRIFISESNGESKTAGGGEKSEKGQKRVNNKAVTRSRETRCWVLLVATLGAAWSASLLAAAALGPLYEGSVPSGSGSGSGSGSDSGRGSGRSVAPGKKVVDGDEEQDDDQGGQEEAQDEKEQDEKEEKKQNAQGQCEDDNGKSGAAVSFLERVFHSASYHILFALTSLLFFTWTFLNGLFVDYDTVIPTALPVAHVRGLGAIAAAAVDAIAWFRGTVIGSSGIAAGINASGRQVVASGVQLLEAAVAGLHLGVSWHSLECSSQAMLGAVALLVAAKSFLNMNRRAGGAIQKITLQPEYTLLVLLVLLAALPSFNVMRYLTNVADNAANWICASIL